MIKNKISQLVAGVGNIARLVPRRALWGAVGIGLAIWLVAVLGIFGYERLILWASEHDAIVGTSPIDPLFAFKMPGIDRPPTVEAVASRLRPDEEVIGVIVDGKARAYRLDAFRDRSQHVVNDLVQGAPVTVSYCDISNCVRTYRGRQGSPTLGVSVAGIYKGSEMVLNVDGTLFFQKSGQRLETGPGPLAIPLEELSPDRTTWREWKRIHPDTDVYEGAR